MITGVRIHGKCFRDESELQFFPQDKHRIAVVYGRNGSGKSTVSQAFLRAAPTASDLEPDDRDESFEDADSNGGKPALDSAILMGYPPSAATGNQWAGTVSVFDEAFIDAEIKIESDGIAAVLLFGSDIELRNAIVARRSQWEDAKRSRGIAESQRNSAEYGESAALRQVERKLKGSLASRSRRILQSTNATTSWKATIQEVENTKKPEASLAECSVALEEKILRHEAIAKSDPISPSWKVQSREELLRPVNVELLQEVVDIPSGEGLLSRVAASLKEHEELVRRALSTFSTFESGHCPMCQQDVESSYREDLLDAIRKSLNGADGDLVKRLDDAKVPELSLGTYFADPRVGDEVAKEFREDVLNFNKQASLWNEVVERKKTQIYAAINWDESDLLSAADRLSTGMSNLAKHYANWNKEVEDRQIAQQELMAENYAVARLEFDLEFREWQEAKRLTKSANDAYSKSIEVESQAYREMSELQERSSNPREAIGIINGYLRSIFADAERMKLEIIRDDNEIAVTRYGILGRGVRLKPEDLSVGERNILALSYFFAKVRRQVDDAPTGRSHLAVLDDPISSVDVDNRLGIHGFLESRMCEYVSRSARARILLMTHDLTAARDFLKSAIGAMENVKGVSSKSAARKAVCSFLLEAGESASTLRKLNDKELESLNEYQDLMAVMYEFAKMEPGEEVGVWQRLAIGNVVRRVLEAFSTFIYKSGILDSILLAEYSAKYPGRELAVDMRAGHRGFLHDSSHSQDRMTAIRDYGGIAGISDQEKVVHVRRILGLMFALQETHMRQYLPLGADEVVSAWKDDLVGG